MKIDARAFASIRLWRLDLQPRPDELTPRREPA